MTDQPKFAAKHFMENHRDQIRQRYPRRTIDRICPVCGTHFKAYRQTARFCTDQCRSRAWRRKNSAVSDDLAAAINGAKRLVRWLGTHHTNQVQGDLRRLSAALEADARYFRPNGIELARTFRGRHGL